MVTYTLMEKKCYEVYDSAKAEVIVKKSKFIGESFSVKNEEEVASYVAAAKKKYYDARHHCFAYCLADENSIRSSDDGEPSGTAGRPILDVILGEGMRNTLVIVTRYFGGTLLGTGGLTRAYKDAAKAVIDETGKLEICTGVEVIAFISYELLGKAENVLRSADAVLIDTEYSSDVKMTFVASEEVANQIIKQFTEISSGAVKYNMSEIKSYGLVDNRVIWL